MTTGKRSFFEITKAQSAEFGQVAVLAAVFFALYLRENTFVGIAFVLALINNVTLPVLFYPFAALWLGLSGLLNRISTAVVLTLVFFIVVTPIGLIRRLMGRDNLKLKQFKKGTHSVMTDRNHVYTAADLGNTF
jgi:hypothetical protein